MHGPRHGEAPSMRALRCGRCAVKALSPTRAAMLEIAACLGAAREDRAMPEITHAKPPPCTRKIRVAVGCALRSRVVTMWEMSVRQDHATVRRWLCDAGGRLPVMSRIARVHSMIAVCAAVTE